MVKNVNERAGEPDVTTKKPKVSNVTGTRKGRAAAKKKTDTQVLTEEDFDSQGPIEDPEVNEGNFRGIHVHGAAVNLTQRVGGQPTAGSSSPPHETAIISQNPVGSIMTAPFAQRNAGILDKEMASTGLLEKVLQRTADFEQNMMTIMAEATKASETAVVKAQQVMKRIDEGIGRLEDAMKHQTACINEIHVNRSETTTKLHDGIQEMKTAVKEFQDLIQERCADNNLMIGGPPLRAAGGIEACGQQPVALDVDETPTEYCSINFQGERHALLLTHTEEAFIRGATTDREVVRRILTKYYTPVQLQRMTLKGRGLKGEVRPQLPGWLVELVQEALKKRCAIGEPQPGEDIEKTRLRDQTLKALRKTTRGNISYICQYNRDTRDSDGNMKKRQKTSKEPENVMVGDIESGENDGGN